MSKCYDSTGALTKNATCAGYVTELKDADYKLYSDKVGGMTMTSYVDFSSLAGGTVVENPAKKNVDSLSKFAPNDLKNALDAAGYVQKSSCPKPSSGPGSKPEPCPSKKTTETYMALMIAFIILTVMGWTLFTLKATGTF